MKERIALLTLICLTLTLLAACTSQKAPQTDTTAPAVPNGLTAQAGDTQVSLSWTANSETDFKRYIIYQGTSNSNLSSIANTSESKFTVTGLTNGQSYFFALEAEDETGNVSAKTAPVSATPQASTEDTLPPSLISSSPVNGAADVALNANLSFTFSEAMNQATTEAALSFSPTVACSFSWNGAGDKLTCNPDSDLAAATTYSVSISTGAQDLASNPLEAQALSFSTGSTSLANCTFNSSTFNSCLFGN